jgi:hypothetical protein
MNKQTDLSIKVLLEFAPYIFAVLLVCVIAQTAVGLIPANQANVQIERQPHRAAKLAGPVTWGSPDQPYGKRRPVTDADREGYPNLPHQSQEADLLDEFY